MAWTAAFQFHDRSTRAATAAEKGIHDGIATSTHKDLVLVLEVFLLGVEVEGLDLLADTAFESDGFKHEVDDCKIINLLVRQGDTLATG